MEMSYFRCCKLLLILSLVGVTSGALQRVLFIFRHGDRTTDKPLFPSDPNTGSSSFYVNGKGDLTDEGKEQGYQLGKRLRDMYQSFLTNSTQEVHAKSSEYSRVVITTGCVLTGMYTPDNNESCVKGSGFPTNIFTLPADKDYMLNTDSPCQALNDEKAKMKNLSAAQDYFNKNAEAITTLANNTGYNAITDYSTVYDIYDTLVIEKIHQLNISSWVDPMWPTLLNLAYEEIPLEFQTDASLRLTSGTLINEIIEQLHAANSSENKVYLYGTHDTNIISLMISLNVFNGLPPPYVATFIIELHDNSTIRMMYINSTDAPISITLPQCPDYCPVDQFVNITMPLVLKDPSEECKSSSASMQVDSGAFIILLQLLIFFHLF